MPSSDEEVVEEPQNRRTRMSLGTKGLKVNLFPGLSPSALKVPSHHQQTSSYLASWPPVSSLSSRHPSPLHSPIPFFQFLLSFSPVRVLLYPVLWAKGVEVETRCVPCPRPHGVGGDTSHVRP